MYKVIIADDQMPVLEYLKAKLPWQELGLELIAVCSDGEEALHACKILPPDILITDIGMPIMNGLELIEEARKINPGLKTVILSCHEEFHFAQQAVKLNVNDYILKETMRIEQLLDMLQQLILQLQSEKAVQNEHLKLQAVVSHGLSALKTTFLRSLIDQPVWDETEWEKKAGNLGIRLTAGYRYLPVLCTLERFSDIEERFGGAHQVRFVVENALNESVQIADHVVLTFDERSYYILYPYPKTIKVNIMDMITDELFKAQKMFLRNMKIGVSFYLGEGCDSMTTLKKQIRFMQNIKTFRFYSGEHRILKAQQMETTEDELFVHYSEAVNDIRNCIQLDDAERLKYMIEKWLKHIESKRYPVDSVRGWVIKIVSDIELKYSVMQHFLTNYSAELMQQKIYAIDTLDHLGDGLYHYLVEKMDSIRVHKDHSIRKEIAEAQRYVLMHLNEKIVMDDMARSLNLNPTHFSRIFKKETGETFVEFVTRSKMERAQELLDKSNQSIEQISLELAYDNSSYFNKLFRAFSGMSPNEYRKKI
ncbi:helix-turn-helix domain-containing protein [Paenibacillus alkaliterrae]|uniref:response regulator transcription factor n=1 Tax=Paenibacillus alkaliterrae TaxID=320909 RepID=UPI001F3274E6|nr:helix-turn-helix domain-containing protein [Paenibacillus alkaliterrae]MCF2938038.1 helix-turn-helix domain-containing protein [Paenibacillus alkaliterrae]